MSVLGVSVYPDLRPIEEIDEYLKLAGSYGYTRVFSSMFSVAGTAEEVLSLFRRLCASAHEAGMLSSVDINPEFMERIGATPGNLRAFHEIGVDIIRMDGAYGEDDNVRMLENPYGMAIEYNASALSTDAIAGLVRRGVDIGRVFACHNFYPQRYTGFRWDRFLEVNERLSSLGIRIGAFVASHNPVTHGVWDAICGLPTVEALRDMPADQQARILHAGRATDIFFGNAYATEEELAAVAKALAPYEPCYLSEAHEQAVANDLYLDQERLMRDPKRIALEPAFDLAPVEREILFDFFPHVDMGDSSEWIWRNRMPRVFYRDRSIPVRPYAAKEFSVGDVVIVNDAYKHYAGEVQVVLRPIANDGTRNYAGHISEQEMMIFDTIYDGDTLRFLPSR